MPSLSSASWTKRFEPQARPATHRNPAGSGAKEAQGQFAAAQAAEPARSGGRGAAVQPGDAHAHRDMEHRRHRRRGSAGRGDMVRRAGDGRGRDRQCGGRCRAQGRRNPDRRHQAHGQDDRLYAGARPGLARHALVDLALVRERLLRYPLGSRTHASRAGCPTRCASSSSSASLPRSGRTTAS